MSGADGSDGSDTPPVPAALVADTLNTYPVPFDSPVTSTFNVDAATPVANVDHVSPSAEYSTV